MSTAERRLSERVAAALDSRSFDVEHFALLLTQSTEDSQQLMRIVFAIIRYGAIAYDNGAMDNNANANAKRLNDTMEDYGMH